MKKITILLFGLFLILIVSDKANAEHIGCMTSRGFITDDYTGWKMNTTVVPGNQRSDAYRGKNENDVTTTMQMYNTLDRSWLKNTIADLLPTTMIIDMPSVIKTIKIYRKYQNPSYRTVHDWIWNPSDNTYYISTGRMWEEYRLRLSPP